MVQRSRMGRIAVAVMMTVVLGSACSATVDLETQPLPSATPVVEATATPTPMPTATPIPSAARVRAGQCFTSEELHLVGGTPVACDQPHIAEFFAVTVRAEPPGATWPGLGTIAQDATEYCNRQFGEAFGVAGELSALQILFFRPDLETWAEGDRQIACFVEFMAPTTEELATIDPQRAFGLVSTFALRTGDCIASPSLTDDTAVELVDCEESHYFEVYESVRMPDGDFPGEDLMSAFVDDTCGPSFEAYVASPQAVSSLVAEALFPTEQSWTEWGDRSVSCVIALAEPTTGSVEGSGL